MKKYKRIDAQLRRLCERKGSGKLNVPISVHEMWAKGGTTRDELRMLLEQVELDKEWFMSKNQNHKHLFKTNILYIDVPQSCVYNTKNHAYIIIYRESVFYSMPKRIIVGSLSPEKVCGERGQDD